MGVDREKQAKASHTLEELEPVLKEIVRQLRMGVSDDLAYALVYRLRREVGYVVRELGAGAPLASNDQRAEEIIESQKWLPRRCV
jgi:hypothetical protein